MEYCIVDAGYKTPAIAKLLLDDGAKPIFPYKRPMTIEGLFKKYEYVYDEYNDCYIYPANHVLEYSTTNRMVIKNTRAAVRYVQNANICHSVRQAKIIRK